jgi:pSer/pThr/pTyr-binding forkhead associated (FHA) protein
MARIVLKEVDSEVTLSVPDTEASIGRDPAASFVIQGPNSKVVSARHARVFYEDNGWWITDSSRNGTIVDDERLQQGQRHALRVGQVIGFGESGPRYRVVVLDSRLVAETVHERPNINAPAKPSGAKPIAAAAAAMAGNVDGGTMHARNPQAMQSAVDMEESTEPMSPAPDWLVHVTLRFTKTNQTYDVRAQTVKIGRSTECNVQVPPEQGPAVSRLHAEIAIHEGGVVVRDDGSRNGTYLNNRRLDSFHPVMRGDMITLGAGGPTFAIDDLHIVRAQTSGPGAPGAAAARRASPQPAPAAASRRFTEPATAPAGIGGAGAATQFGAPSAKNGLLKNVLEDAPEASARRMRLVIWAVVAGAIIVAALFIMAGR